MNALSSFAARAGYAAVSVASLSCAASVTSPIANEKEKTPPYGVQGIGLLSASPTI
ncbi:hypothetical protein GCM10007043_12370 [Calditerricola satsumensis]|uniref:Uncharacterized protein n=1 Tax=Calditerricola satsumensis TaxID=373054 RepID=A0A8J3B7H0_9BACI|nr:hypothetical protein GCM10007043_12370 [Calditerricola satsumensis]